MSGTPLVLGGQQRELLQALRMTAANHAVDIVEVCERMKTPEGKRVHMNQMNGQSVVLPFGYIVTFSIERGHPCGVCRHMSMSSPSSGRVPTRDAVWMVAELLGFAVGLEACAIWAEDLQRGRNRAQAINVVQPIDVHPAAAAPQGIS